MPENGESEIGRIGPAATIILAVLLVFLAGHFIKALGLNAALINHPYSIEHNEGAVLQLSYDLSRGKSIYRPLQESPFVPGDYPPLFLALNAIAIKISGLNLQSGRLLSFLAAVGIALVIGHWNYHVTGSKLWAACSVLTIFLSPLFFSLCSFYRVDVFAVALSFLGVFVIVRVNSDKGDLAAVVCFVLSLYTKHSMIAGPAAALLILAREDRGRAKRFALRLVGAGGVLFLLLTVMTRQEFFRHLVLYHAMSYDWSSFQRHLLEFGKWTAPAIALSVFLFIHWKNKQVEPILIYWATSMIHLLFLMRAGASMHYVLEPSAVSFLAATVGIPLLLEHRARPGVVAAITLCAFMFCQGVIVGRLPQEHFETAKVMTALESMKKRDSALLAFIKDKGDILAEDQSYALLSGNDSVVSPFHIAQLSREGRFNQAEFLTDIEQGSYPVLILHSPLDSPSRGTRLSFTDEVLEAMGKHYRSISGPWPGRYVYAWRER